MHVLPHATNSAEGRRATTGFHQRIIGTSSVEGKPIVSPVDSQDAVRRYGPDVKRTRFRNTCATRANGNVNLCTPVHA